MGAAVGADLASVARECAPPPNLFLIHFRDSPPKIIAAIPLKPAARIRANNPPLFPPHRQRLPRLDLKIIERNIGVGAYLRPIKPIGRQFLRAVIAILPFKHAQLQHFLRGKMGQKRGRKIRPHWRGDLILIPLLHQIAHRHQLADLRDSHAARLSSIGRAIGK